MTVCSAKLRLKNAFILQARLLGYKNLNHTYCVCCSFQKIFTLSFRLSPNGLPSTFCSDQRFKKRSFIYEFFILNYADFKFCSGFTTFGMPNTCLMSKNCVTLAAVYQKNWKKTSPQTKKEKKEH